MAAIDKRLVGHHRQCAKVPAWSASPTNIPDRYYDVGIAEQHALTFAAGLACEGRPNPVVAIYLTFLQRAYDQLIHDVALQNLPVMMARPSRPGRRRRRHPPGAFDLSFCACIPNMTISPGRRNECRRC